MGDFMKILKISFATLLCAFTISAGQTPAEKILDCHSGGGGYVTQDLKVNRVGNELIAFELQRFSPVPEIVPDMGLKMDGKLAKRAKFQFAATLCLTKATATAHVTLVACSTGISKVSAELTLLDGSSTTITLPDNFGIEVEQVDTQSVFQSRTGSQLNVALRGEPATGLGFRLRECR